MEIILNIICAFILWYAACAIGALGIAAYEKGRKYITNN